MPITTAPWTKPLGLNFKQAADAIRSGNITVALDGANGAPTAFKGAMASIVSRQNVKKAMTSLYGVSAITIAPYISGSNLVVPRQYTCFGGEVVELYDPTTFSDLIYPLSALADGTYMLKIELFGALVGASTAGQALPTGLAGITDAVNKPSFNTLFGNGNTAAGSINAVSDSFFVGGSTVQQQKFVQLQYALTLVADADITGTAATIDSTVNYAADATLYPWGVSATLASDGIVPESTSRAFVITRVVKSGAVYTVVAPRLMGDTLVGRQNVAQVSPSLPYMAQRLNLLEDRVLSAEQRLTNAEGGLMLSPGANKAWKLCSLPVGATAGNNYLVAEVDIDRDRRTYYIGINSGSVIIQGLAINTPSAGGVVEAHADGDGTIGIYYLTAATGNIAPHRYRLWGKNIIPSGGSTPESGVITTPELFGFSTLALVTPLLATSNVDFISLISINNHETRLFAIENAPAKRFAKLGTSPFENSSTYPKFQTHYADGGTGSDPGWAVAYGGLADRTIGPTGSGADSIWTALNSIPGGFANRDIALTIQLYTSTASARAWIADGGYGGALTSLECALQNHKAFGASAKTSLHVIVKTDSQGRFKVRHQFDDYNVGTYHECFLFIFLNGYYVN